MHPEQSLPPTEALSNLGLNEQVLTEALKMGYLARATCTANDAPFFPALAQWNGTQRGLREQVLLLGWTKSDEGNYCTVISPDGDLAIAVASGCENTGNPSLLPTTKSPKGPNTLDAIIANAAQLSLPNLAPAPTFIKSEDGKVTWLLLFYATDKEIRAELSLPASMGFNGRPDTWKERIILSAIPLDPIVPDVKPDFSPELDIQVKRRA